VDDKRAGTPPDHDGDDPADTHEAAPDPPVGRGAATDPRTTIAGRYSVDLTAPLAASGITIAHAGRDLRTRDPVVVKTLRIEYRGDPEMRARFRREARLLQFLSHPNVIRALTFTEERGAPWLVLEHVRGRSLREMIADEAPLSPEAVVPLLAGVASALDHLHARGLAHLDVRPENIVVSPDGEVKLVDFGVAQTSGTVQESADGGAPGVAAYVAPEQACGEPVSAATDVYALGCVVYELLTGEPPFSAGATPAARHAALRARLEGNPLPPTVARGGNSLPGWVDDVVLGALERDPRQRYGSAGSFAAVFRSGVEGDVDVETGRPRRREEPTRPRRAPLNEPGIAVKGSPRLASRRAEPADVDEPVIEATFAPVPLPKPAPARAPSRIRLPDPATLNRRLWQTVVVAAALNVLLIVALLLTRGEIPGIWRASSPIGPGATVRVAGVGLVAREAPETDAAIVADLPEGGAVRISGEAVAGDGGLWWPVEVDVGNENISGYVPESWVQPR
jgi:serine/threonine-protein kinase